MRSTPLIALIAAVLLTAGIYFLNTIPPKPEATKGAPQAPMAGAMTAQTADFNIDSLILAVKKSASQHVLGELQSIEKQAGKVTDSLQLAPFFTRYGQLWQEHKQFALAAYYYSLAAKLENSQKKLTFAAQLFLDLARKEHSAGMQNWEVANAVACFEQSLKLNPDNDTVRLGLAECYFGTGEAMKGVVLLKEITNKDPENKAANLLLGQQGLVSGQFDKARQRFETVLKNEPENLEAMLGLAEAYKGLGTKEKAIELLEKSKKLIKNPEFEKDIDAYIKTFK